MKLICPSCAAVASAESWVNDANCRETMLVISRLPSPLPKAILGYLSLFRPGQQSLDTIHLNSIPTIIKGMD